MGSLERNIAIKNILASIFASQRALKTLAPEFKWSGLGNLLGDFGELMAIEEYEFIKAPSGSGGFDAIDRSGKKIQIKTNYVSKEVGFRGNADVLLVISVNDDGSWSELYYGPFGPIQDASRFSKRDNKNMITISKLKDMQKVHGFNSQNAEQIPEIVILPATL